MNMDYATPDRRRTKNDLKLKRKRRAYKRGGNFRSMDINPENKKEEEE